MSSRLCTVPLEYTGMTTSWFISIVSARDVEASPTNRSMSKWMMPATPAIWRSYTMSCGRKRGLRPPAVDHHVSVLGRDVGENRARASRACLGEQLLIGNGESSQDHMGGARFEPRLDVMQCAHAAGDLHRDRGRGDEFADEGFVRGVLAQRRIHIEEMQPLRALGLELGDRLQRRERVDDVLGLGRDPCDHLALGNLDFGEDQHGANSRVYSP